MGKGTSGGTGIRIQTWPSSGQVTTQESVGTGQDEGWKTQLSELADVTQARIEGDGGARQRTGLWPMDGSDPQAGVSQRQVACCDFTSEIAQPDQPALAQPTQSWFYTDSTAIQPARHCHSESIRPGTAPVTRRRECTPYAPQGSV